MDRIINRLIRAMELTYDYYDFIQESSLKLDIPGSPSNSIGDQAWCVVGARESYLRALVKGSWDGFACSLHNPLDKTQVIDKLKVSAINIQNLPQTTSPEKLNVDLLIDLLEHEVQHHGQLIRYSYANKLGFPESWTKRYTVR